MVDLVRNLLDHLGLLSHLHSKVLIFLLNMLHDHLDLIEVALLVVYLLPLEPNKLVTSLRLVVWHLLSAQMLVLVPESLHLVCHWVIRRSVALSLFDQVLHICGSFLNDFNDWVSWVFENFFKASLASPSSSMSTICSFSRWNCNFATVGFL